MGMKFTKIPTTTFQELQLNAGVLVSEFTPGTGTIDSSNILGATTGGISFSATPSYTDMGDDVDNCPKNMMELKRLDSWDISISGTYVTVNTARAKSLIGAADIGSSDTTLITPRNDIQTNDFEDIWWVGDYSDKNSGETGGFIAVHMMHALSTGGFKIQSGNKSKGQFAFTYTAHFSNTSQDTVPFELYIKSGT